MAEQILVGRSFMKDEQRATILDELPGLDRCAHVLELGTGHGVTVAWWARRRPHTRFLTIDDFKAAKGTGPGIIEDWLKNREPNQHLFVGTPSKFRLYMPRVEFDCVFVDDGHGYEDTIFALDALVPLVRPSGKVLMHDYGRTNVPELCEVTRATDDWIENNPWHVARIVGGSVAVIVEEIACREK